MSRRRGTVFGSAGPRSFVRADRADRWAGRFARNKDAVTSHDDPADRPACDGISTERSIMDALAYFKSSDRLGWIRRFVGVNRHINGYARALFHQPISASLASLTNEAFMCRR